MIVKKEKTTGFKMSDILGITSRGLIPDISIEQSSSLPTGDSDFEDTQLQLLLSMDIANLPHSSDLQNLVKALHSTDTVQLNTTPPTDPVTQWLERNLGISAQFAQPAPTGTSELEAILTAASPPSPAIDILPAGMMPDQPVASIPVKGVDETAEVTEAGQLLPTTNLQDIFDPITTWPPSVAMPFDQAGKTIPDISQKKSNPEQLAVIQTAELVIDPSGQADLNNLRMLPGESAALATPKNVTAKQGGVPLIKDAVSPPLQPTAIADAKVGQAQAIDLQTSGMIATAPAAEAQLRPAMQQLRASSATTTGDTVLGQTPASSQQEIVAQPEKVTPKQGGASMVIDAAPLVTNAMLDGQPRPDLPLGLQTTRDLAAAHPTQHAPTAQTDPRPVMQQITSAMVTTRKDATEIALSPEELGRIRLVMSGPDRNHVTIWAERPETLDLVRRNADMLTQHLQEAGIDAQDLDFRQDSGGTWQNGTPDTTGLGDHDLAGPATITHVQLTPTPVSDRRIDIRL
jgi:hypothetical protein